jgi:hypothetical protein
MIVMLFHIGHQHANYEIYMINKVLFFVIICLSLTQMAMATGVSETTNGVYLVIGAVRNNNALVASEPIKYDDQLVWDVCCDAGETELSCPDFRYSLKVKMTGTNGVELLKTAKGKRMGTRYDQLHKITDCKVFPVVAWGTLKDHYPGKLFAKPNELFQIDTPGIYTLEIQMQMFRYVASRDVDERSKTLFRFSPVKISVVKP